MFRFALLSFLFAFAASSPLSAAANARQDKSSARPDENAQAQRQEAQRQETQRQRAQTQQAQTQIDAQAGTQDGTQYVTVGRVEKVYVPAVDSIFKARMDTGAETSSIDAKIIEIEKKKDGDRIVTFSIADENGDQKILEERVARTVRIKTKEGGYIRRPVIRMTFCIGGREIDEEVNLSERTHFLYQVLIGRNTMTKGELIVNPAKTFMTNPVCNSDKKSDTDRE